MFKKVVVADRLAALVNVVYDSPTEYEGLTLILATVFFAFQIYCDFSGYSDIAIGAARVLGFDLMTNFRTPYFSKSISEFWRRWHISLSSWFKDYVYIPLGGNRVVKWRWYYNLIVTFLVSGLWHGANWTFVIWGGLHGAYLVFSILSKGYRNRANRFLRIHRRPDLMRIWDVGLIFVLVCFAWIFFRANTLSDAFYIAGSLFDGKTGDISSIMGTIKGILTGDHQVGFDTLLPVASGAHIGMNIIDLFLSFAVIGFTVVIEYLESQPRVRRAFFAAPRYLRWAMYYVVLFAILFMRSFEVQEFIYFQF